MTDLNKPVRRRTIGRYRGRRIVACFEPGDIVGFRLERTRSLETLSIAGCYEYAVKCRVAMERSKKAAERKAKLKG